MASKRHKSPVQARLASRRVVTDLLGVTAKSGVEQATSSAKSFKDHRSLPRAKNIVELHPLAAYSGVEYGPSDRFVWKARYHGSLMFPCSSPRNFAGDITNPKSSDTVFAVCA
jgi:hypothetical protein